MGSMYDGLQRPLTQMRREMGPFIKVWKEMYRARLHEAVELHPVVPYARQLLTEEGTSTWDVWLEEVGDLVRELIALPAQTGRILTRMERGELVVNTPQANRQVYHLEGAVNRLRGAFVFAAFLLGGVFLYNAGDPTPVYVFWGFSLLSLFWMMFFSRGHSPWR